MTVSRTSQSSNAEIAVRNSAFGIFSLGSRLAGNLVVFLVIARSPSIDVVGFGQLTYAFAVASLFVLVSQFGLAPLMIRDIAADHKLLKDYVQTAIGLRLLLSVIGFVLFVLFVNVIEMTPDARIVCYLMGVAMYLGSLSTDIQALFQSQERMNLELFGIAFENVLLLALTFSAMFLGIDVVGVAWIFVITKMSAFLLNYFVCGKRLLWITISYDRLTWGRLLVKALPFALTSLLAAGMLQLDTLLLRELAISGDEAVGIYQAAIRLFLIPMLLPEVVSKVFLPQLSRMHGQEGGLLTQDLGRLNHLLVTLGLLISLVTIFRAEDLVLMIYGERYIAAGAILQILGVTIAMRFGTAYNLYFNLRDRVWFRVWSAALALIAGVIFNNILIPEYGATGAAYASVLTHVILWIPYLVAVFISEGSMRLGLMPIRTFFVAIILTIVLYISSKVKLALIFPLYAILCIIGSVGSMSNADRKLIIFQIRKSLPL